MIKKSHTIKFVSFHSKPSYFSHIYSVYEIHYTRNKNISTNQQTKSTYILIYILFPNINIISSILISFNVQHVVLLVTMEVQFHPVYFTLPFLQISMENNLTICSSSSFKFSPFLLSGVDASFECKHSLLYLPCKLFSYSFSTVKLWC